MKKGPTAAANRAALARRRQRVATGTIDSHLCNEQPAKVDVSFEVSIPSLPVKESENFSSGPTPIKSNFFTGSPPERIRDFVDYNGHPSPTLVENQQAIGNKPLVPSSRQSNKTTTVRPSERFEPKKLSQHLAEVSDKETDESMPPSLEQQYTEEPEPSLEEDGILDASTLNRASLVVLKTFSYSKSLKVERREDTCLVELNGLGLAAGDEIFEIHPKAGTVVRYGQAVMIFSRTANAYLGVRTKGRDQLNGVSFALGFFRKQVSDVETWTILHGERKLLIGSAARSVKFPPGLTPVVRVGDPIVLRNCFIGGLLSVSEGIKLSLVTHAYDSNESSQSSLIDRAIRHYEFFPSQAELFQFWFAHTPPCPPWTCLSEVPSEERPIETVSQLCLNDQESLLLDEVIGSLMGLDCNLIRRRQDGFVVSEGIDKSLRNLVDRVLPIASGYIHVKSFLRRHQPGYEYGTVMQALCEEIDVVLADYVCSVEALEIQYRFPEKNKLTMHHAFVELQPLACTIDLLEHVVRRVEGKMGGALLNTIRELQMTRLGGDLRKQALLKRLLSMASVPWMRMLSTWLMSGDIFDPCGEFMIAKKNAKRTKVRSSTWNNMFYVQKEHVFRGAIASDILEGLVLTTGKYWNAVRQCEKATFVDAETRLDIGSQMLVYTGDPSTISSYIESVHKSASAYLVELLLGEFQVESTLLTLKRYFLLDQGDFLVHFMDTVGSELAKLTDDVSVGRTQHCLNMALQLTDPVASESSTKLSRKNAGQPLTSQSMRCYFADESLDVMLGVRDGETKTITRSPYGQVAGLTGMLAFSLDFSEIPFPTSLVLSEGAMSSYQMLFRHIFYAKHIEQRLVAVWLDNQMMREFESIRSLLGGTFCLRHRMLHFIQNFIYYMMLEVIEPNWLDMMQKIPKQDSADDLINLHNQFLGRIMEDCLLTNPSLFKSLAKIMSTCLTFSEQMKRFVETTGIADDKNVSVSKVKRESLIRQQQQQVNDYGATTHSTGDKAKIAMRAIERKENDARRRKQACLIERELKNDTFQRMVKRHEEVFDDNLDDFMGKLRTKVYHQSQISNLCIRLDFNGFLASSRSSKR